MADTVASDAGAERQVANLAARLDPSLFEVHVCCFEDSARLRELGRCCRTQVFPLESLWTAAGLRGIRAFQRYVAAHQIEVVHAFLPKSCIFSVLGAAWSRRRAVITSRVNTGYIFTPRLAHLFRLLNRKTTRIFANSEAVKSSVMEIERALASQIDVQYNGIDVEHYRARALSGPPIFPGHLVVGIVANLRPIKDLPLFLRACAVLSKQAPEVRFLVAGSGPLRADLGRLAGELGLADVLSFTDGRLPIPECLAQMSVGCLTSHSEGFSNAILEYMAAGLPTVAMDAGGNREAVLDGATGFLVQERSPEAFAAPVLRLLKDAHLRSKLGQRAAQVCRERFSFERIIPEHERYYEQLARGTATNGHRAESATVRAF